jgi:hypothetical protein
MFVYGVRCSPAAVASLASLEADYYMDHGILVFPTYTRPTVIDARGSLTPEFWSRVATVVGRSCREIDVLEHPYIRDDEAAALAEIRESVPGAVTSWYYIPAVVPPSLVVSDL